MKSNRVVVAALALTMGAGAGFVLAQETGQDAAKGKEAKVRKLLEVTGAAEIGRETMNNMLAEFAAIPDLPGGFVEKFKALAKPEDLVDLVVPIYMKHLDDETLDAAIAFYQSPAGKKLAKSQTAISEESAKVGQQWGMNLVQKVLGEMGINPMEDARMAGNEAAAIGALKTVSTAQSLFREGDKDNDNQFNYAGDLAALGKAQLIDDVLASGKKQGYSFEVCNGSEAPEFIWMAVASPVEAGKTGKRHFAVNHEGVIYWSETAFELDRVKCTVKGGQPVGR